MDVYSFDLYNYVLNLTAQIPSGKISTYKHIAIALGDEISARSVGVVLNHNPFLLKIPCHRVIHSDGRIGGYKLGVKEKINLLKKEGFEIEDEYKGENAKVKNFENYIFENFNTDYPLKFMKKIQKELSRKVVIEDEKDYLKDYEDNKISVCGFDCAYKFINDKEYGFGALIFENKFFTEMEIKFPYIPTYLAFREIPLIEKLIKNVEKEKILLMVDGNGILHPENFGIASHIGVKFDIPTIGVAKSYLCGKLKGDNIFIDDKIVGRKIGKIYISPGHKISLNTSVDIVKKFLKYKIPEPIRIAHIYANKMKNGNFVYSSIL